MVLKVGQVLYPTPSASVQQTSVQKVKAYKEGTTTTKSASPRGRLTRGEANTMHPSWLRAVDPGEQTGVGTLHA